MTMTINMFHELSPKLSANKFIVGLKPVFYQLTDSCSTLNVNFAQNIQVIHSRNVIGLVSQTNPVVDGEALLTTSTFGGIESNRMLKENCVRKHLSLLKCCMEYLTVLHLALIRLWISSHVRKPT